MKLVKINRIIVTISMTIFLVACDKVFEFSPYEANVNTESKGTTKKNLGLMVKSNGEKFCILDYDYLWSYLKFMSKKYAFIAVPVPQSNTGK